VVDSGIFVLLQPRELVRSYVNHRAIEHCELVGSGCSTFYHSPYFDVDGRLALLLFAPTYIPLSQASRIRVRRAEQ